MVQRKGEHLTSGKGKHEEKTTSVDSWVTVWCFMAFDQHTPFVS